VFPQNCRVIDLRLAASFISTELAEISLERELPNGIPPREFARQGEAEWNRYLSRIMIQEAREGQADLFYSCLYRCLLFPRFLDERDADGTLVHYSPFDGRIHPGRLCADTGFWDTYRTLQPLLTWIYPDVMEQMMEGWLNVCRESGWTPKWPSPGARNCMIGTHFNVTAADVVVKGLTNWGVEEVYEYLRKDAFVPSEDGRFGRQGLEDYMQLGFVAADRTPYAVSSTLDFAYDDFCVSRVARYLGRTTDEADLQRRAHNYQNVFDTATGFMRAKTRQGRWMEPFNEFEWGGAYIEGGPWQHSFNVPHDVQGMARLWGGSKLFCEKLDGLFDTPPTFEAGHYGREIHEMTEMAVASFGQYAHSNQPVHNYLFLFAQCGQPEKTEFWVSRVLKELYSVDHFPGDEDNGEMAAWYIWASLGLYPTCPGKPEYLKLNSRVRHAEIRLPGSDGPIELDDCLRGVQSGETVLHPQLKR
nr:glycoside hydrolase family 92 protein [Kiritimatiellia bacterium]